MAKQNKTQSKSATVNRMLSRGAGATIAEKLRDSSGCAADDASLVSEDMEGVVPLA
jgi:hypothetical protein